MQRWQGAALAVVLCAGCLDPLVSDDPGYSRYVLAPASAVPSGYDDLQINRKIDVNDGVTAPPGLAVKNGFAAGQPVRYWDFGASKRSSTPVYGLATCNAGGKEPYPHPPIVDSIPGDTDYSPFRAQYWACITPKYRGQIVPSLDALNDAIDLGLVTDPTGEKPAKWVNMPIVAPTAGSLPFSNGVTSPAATMYYRGLAVLHYSLESQEGSFDYADKTVPTGNVYELMKPGQTTAARVIFSQPYWAPSTDPEAPPARNPAYSPNWLVVTVALKAQTAGDGKDPAANAAALDALIEMFTQESDFVTVGMNNTFTLKDKDTDPLGASVKKGITSVTATMNRVNRPFIVNDMTEVAQ